MYVPDMHAPATHALLKFDDFCPLRPLPSCFVILCVRDVGMKLPKIQPLSVTPPNDFSYTGRNFYYGIREHAMGSILNGISYFGLHRCSGSTFLVFADYMRAPMRVAALSELPVNYILTHDSIGVGEVRREEREVRGGVGGFFLFWPDPSVLVTYFSAT